MRKNALITTLLLTISLTCSACGSVALFGMRPASGEAGEQEAKSLARTVIGNVFEDYNRMSEMECKYFNNSKLAETKEEYEAYWTLGFRNEETGDYEVLVNAVDGSVMQISRCPSEKECAEIRKRSVESAMVSDGERTLVIAGVGSILAKPMTYGQPREKILDVAVAEAVQDQWKAYTDVGIGIFEMMGHEVTDAYSTMIRSEEVMIRDAEGTRRRLQIPVVNVVVTYGDGQVGDVCLTAGDCQILIIHMDRGHIKL